MPLRNLGRVISMIFATPAGVDTAKAACQKLMEQTGFWTPEISKTEIELVLFDAVAAYQMYGHGRGRVPGKICVPVLSSFRVGLALSGGTMVGLLLHEYAHAVADSNRGLIRSRQFSEVFGFSHANADGHDYDPEQHISEYASDDASEDFAECFAEYVEKCGVINPNHPAGVRARLRFIHRLSVAIQSGRRRW